MPKPVLATAAELKGTEDQLRTEINAVRAEINPPVQASAEKLRVEIRSVEEKLNRANVTQDEARERVATDSKTFAETRTEQLRQEFKVLFPSIEQQIVKVEGELDHKIQVTDTNVRTLIADELQQLCVKFDQELTAMREELTSNMEQWAQEAAEALVAQRQEIDQEIANTRKESLENDAQGKADLDTGLKSALEEQQKVASQLDERAKRAENEIYIKLDRLSGMLEEHKEDAAAESSKVAGGAAESLNEFREHTQTHLEALDNEAKKLRDAMSEVENVATRRVEWIIHNASKKLRPLSPSRAMLHTSWFSPKFDAAGAHGLQIELQLFRASDPPVEEENAGDCAVHLWACKGMNMAYKLSVGKKSATFEKVFNGRVPYGTKRFCWLSQQVNHQDDTIRVGLEILEAVREIEHPIAPPVLAESFESKEARAVAEEAFSKQVGGSLFFYRNINNRLLDQVKHEVEIMRSRMVRKIEWRVEHASMLRRCFPPGEPICSTPFNAAGVDGMQLILYPSGYTGCTEGFCSLFVHGPAGASLKCMLCAGTQKRDATHQFEEPGAFGRTNFCRWDNAVDEVEDCVLISLEIQDASQDLRATVAHPVVQCGDRRTQGQLDGTGGGPIESVVKLQRCPGKGVPGFHDVRVLPSLWSAKSLGDTMRPPDGFQSFDIFRKGAKGGSETGTRSGTRRTESMPSLHNGGSGSTWPTGGADVTSELLPQLSQTHAAGVDWEPRGRSAKPRRPRNKNMSATVSMMAPA